MKKSLYRRYLLNLQTFLARPAQAPKQSGTPHQAKPA
jgi:hypothetical protein